jgi:L-2-hydroxyglutarate oxidase LhgO
MRTLHVAIVGGGIVGLATAYRLGQRFPDARVTVLEKEAAVAAHQSSHNSGVLHSGIYYRPGSLRAQNCREGKKAMEAFCDVQGIPYSLCGKVIVAVNESELPTLQNIYERGQANGVRCQIIERQRLLEIEPHAAGIRAIHVPEAGIVDFGQVARRLAELIAQAGGEVRTAARVFKIRRLPDGVVVHTSAGEVPADYLVNCAGLHCDRVTKLTGQRPEAKIVPFRGEFYELKPAAHYLCRGLIYPVPDTNFPFLGVHFTRTIHGGVECGPNAVLAFAREGYRKRDVNLRDLFEALTYPGFLRLVGRHWKIGLGELWRSFSKRAFVKSLKRLVPEIEAEHLETAPAGVRAQALGRDGRLIDDFLIQQTDRIINVGNAPSPAATAALNVGKLIVDKLVERLSGERRVECGEPD